MSGKTKSLKIRTAESFNSIWRLFDKNINESKLYIPRLVSQVIIVYLSLYSFDVFRSSKPQIPSNHYDEEKPSGFVWFGNKACPGKVNYVSLSFRVKLFDIFLIPIVFSLVLYVLHMNQVEPSRFFFKVLDIYASKICFSRRIALGGGGKYWKTWLSQNFYSIAFWPFSRWCAVGDLFYYSKRALEPWISVQMNTLLMFYDD